MVNTPLVADGDGYTEGMGSSARLSRHSKESLWRNWHYMSLMFGINHACVTIPLVYATTLLDSKVGYFGNALLYIFSCVGSLFFALPVLASVGQRASIITGMLFYTVYVGLFAMAA